MLIVRRRAGESLLIGENIEIEILEVAASYAKIGIRAPREIPVLRSEIRLAEEQNRASARINSPQGLQALLERLGGSRTLPLDR